MPEIQYQLRIVTSILKSHSYMKVVAWSLVKVAGSFMVEPNSGV